MRSVVVEGLRDLRDADYFRHRAEQTRRISLLMWQPGVRKTLLDLAQDYEELAEDLAQGITVRHPELLQRTSI